MSEDDYEKKRKLETVEENRALAILTRNKSFSTNYQFKTQTEMLLIPLAEFKKFGSIPRSSDRSCLNMMCYEELMEDNRRHDSLIAFISHKWLNPTLNPKDMHPDHGTCKYDIICCGLERLLSGFDISENDVYLWIDFCCIEQDDIGTLKAGVRSLPAYIERSDIIFTPVTEVKLPLSEACLQQFSEYPELNKFFSQWPSVLEYMSRGWCRLELFMASNCPMPEEGFGYFNRLNITTRSDRPHLFYGTFHQSRGMLPEVGPRIVNSVFTALDPVNGELTVQADKTALQELVGMFDVIVPESDTYTGATVASTDGDVPVPHGKGKLVYASGAVYDGYWENGKWHGFGSYIYVNGTHYTGGWREGKRHGFGQHRLSNGLVFEGLFENALSHGPGKLYYQNGKLKYAGVKVRSLWEGPLEMYYPSGRLRYKGTAINNTWRGRREHYADDDDNAILSTESDVDENV